MYVYNNGAILVRHPVRRSVYTAFAWLLIHLPMSAGLLIGGHVSAASVADELDTPRRWLWGGGLAVGIFCMWVIAQMYEDCDPPKTLIFPKQLRLLPRLLAAVIYALIPLASVEGLNTTSLISIGAALNAFVVIWEMVSALECGALPFESWKGDVEIYETVVDIGNRKKAAAQRRSPPDTEKENGVQDESTSP